MVKPMTATNFVTSSEGSNAIYNFEDLQDGAGIITLYGAKDQSGYVLTKNSAVNSDDIDTRVSSGLQTDYTKQIDADFDVSVNMPLRIRGKATFNIPLRTYGTTAAKSSYSYVIVKFRKWNGTTETEIANGTSSTVVWVVDSPGPGLFYTDAAAKARKAMVFVAVTIPLTVFKKGETMRVTIEVYHKQTAGLTNGNVMIAHDPANRNYYSGTSEWESTDITRMTCFIPSVIDT